MCQVSGVRCQVSGVTCHISILPTATVPNPPPAYCDLDLSKISGKDKKKLQAVINQIAEQKFLNLIKENLKYFHRSYKDFGVYNI